MATSKVQSKLRKMSLPRGLHLFRDHSHSPSPHTDHSHSPSPSHGEKSHSHGEKSHSQGEKSQSHGTKKEKISESQRRKMSMCYGYGCPHYARKCAYVGPCCGKIYSCRVCHDDVEDHRIDRFKVNDIQCTICLTIQPVQKSCKNCGVEFGRYFCATCRMFDDVDKQQYHCDKCGLCRVGGRENFFHCDKCDMCLCKQLKDSHVCVEKVTHSDCPVCLEDLHTSRESLFVLSCGHITHESCWHDMLKNGNYACPLCGHSMLNLSTVWKHLDKEIAKKPMPDELRNIYVWVLCRDCHQRSEVLYHRLGLKCLQCGSYNTCRDDERAQPNGNGHANMECDSETTPDGVGTSL